MIKLDELVFPIYKFRGYKTLKKTNGILEISTHWNDYIVDNTNLRGKTLGERRRGIKTGEIYPFKTFHNSPRDLIFNAKTGDTFIDTLGKLFKYTKTKRCEVFCKKLKNIVKTDNGKSILFIEDFPTVFVVPSLAIPRRTRYVNLVKYGEYYLVYNFSDILIKSFWKKL